MMEYPIEDDYLQYAPAPDTLRLYSISQLWQLFTGAVTDIHEVRTTIRKVESQMKMLIIGQTITILVMIALLINSLYHKYIGSNQHRNTVLPTTIDDTNCEYNINNNNNNNDDCNVENGERSKLPNIILSKSSVTSSIPLRNKISHSLETVRRWNQPNIRTESGTQGTSTPAPEKQPVEVII